MYERMKNSLILKINELKARVNTLEINNELLADKRIDELLKALAKKDYNEKLEEENQKLKIRNQQLREVIKELANGKTHK